MEISVGTKFNKVGTEEIVTVVKYDAKKGTVIVKFPSGRSIPMSTGSLAKEDKWRLVDESEENIDVKKSKRKPMAKRNKSKIQDEMDGILSQALLACDIWDELLYEKTKTTMEWLILANNDPQLKVIYETKEKQFDIYFSDRISELLVGTEFDEVSEINAKFIEDKLVELINTVVAKVNETTKESEETN